MECPICESPNIQHLRIGDAYCWQSTFGVEVMECGECKFLFADFIHPQVIEFFYNSICRTGTTSEALDLLKEEARGSGRSQFKTIEPYLPKKLGRVLDFGGGVGETAKLFIPLADQVFITESNPLCIKEINNEPELTLIDGANLINEEYIGFFDLIIFSNVLEHMTYPVGRIQNFSRLLSQGGQLFVEVPNEAPTVRHNGKMCQQHIGFYTLDTFRNLIEKQGSFDIENLRTCGPKVEDIIAQQKLLHDFDAQETPDGWVIRAMLKNNRPNSEFIDMDIKMSDVGALLAKLSQSVFLMTHDKIGSNQ